MKLPRDVLSIVYRYVFMYNYNSVLKQYANEWVYGKEIKWDERKSCFADAIYKIANWRDVLCDKYTSLYKFGSDNARGKLPFNY